MLAYCMNVHPGESLEDQSRNLEVHAAAVAARFRELRPETAAHPFGIGLRFGAPAAAAFANVIVPTATATAQGLLALRALQFLPPYQNVPNIAESGRVSDDNVAFTLSASYQMTDSTNVYLRYATGRSGAAWGVARGRLKKKVAPAPG